MKFDTTAVVKEIGAIETVGAKGFQKRNVILTEQSGQYENLLCIEFSGDKLALPEQFAEGQMVSVSGFINCREWNGKYFTSMRGSFISAAQPAAGDDYAQNYPQPEDFGQAPAYNAPQPAPTYNAPQQQAPQPAPTYNAPQPAPTYNAPPQPPQFPNNGDMDTPF